MCVCVCVLAWCALLVYSYVRILHSVRWFTQDYSQNPSTYFTAADLLCFAPFFHLNPFYFLWINSLLLSASSYISITLHNASPVVRQIHPKLTLTLCRSSSGQSTDVTTEAQVQSQAFHMELLDKMIVGLVSLWTLRFDLSVIFPGSGHIHSAIIWKMNNESFRSS